MTPEVQDTQKKPYAQPQLRVYGDIRQITQVTNGNGAKNDGGNGNNKSG
jgi:hypothetical protein